MHRAVILAVILLATFLRVYQLDFIPNGLLTDEAMRGYDAYALWQTGADSFGVAWPLFLQGFNDYTPALYSYLSIPFIAVFDLTVMGVRLAAALVGVLTVAATYRFIHFTCGPRAALIGAFLLAVSPWHIVICRTGTEWSLMALGTVLTIVLAQQGLKRPAFLAGAGVVAALALYGYAPVKAFLPPLLLGFVVLYRSELWARRWAVLVATGLFLLLAAPIFLFSFTPDGLKRFTAVSELTHTSLVEAMPEVIRNYFSYFSLRFLFEPGYMATGQDFLPKARRLETVGLLYWFELPLILAGLVQMVRLPQRRTWFTLYWLLVAPLGIALHINSPWPILWLTAIPIPQTWAGAGADWLLRQRPARWRLSAAMVGGIIMFSVGLMVYDLFYLFPVYGARHWLYGKQAAVARLEALKDHFDVVDINGGGLTSSIFILFYTRYDPAHRQAELAQNPQAVWRQIGDYRVGPDVIDFFDEPGCHLVLTSAEETEIIRRNYPYLETLERILGPDGGIAYELHAFPAPRVLLEIEALYGKDQLLLQGVGSTVESTLRPGQAICLISQWQVGPEITTDYTAFVHLTAANNPAALWAQHDRPLANRQQQGQVVQVGHILLAPPDLPPGDYRLEMGVYDPATGSRLAVGPDNDKVILMELNVP